MLQFNEVAFRYGALEVLAGLSFEVGEGEFVCLVGQSGSGKTTIINLAAGYLQPSEGDVHFLNLRVTSPNEERGVVFQEDALFPWFTVKQNAEFGFSSNRNGGHNTTDLLLKAGLEGFEDAYPRQLSGGMKKRAELARAFAANSRLLLLDEPFGSLDVVTRQRMHRLLEDMWMEKRRSVVMVTHDPEEALLLADRVLVLSPRPGHVVKSVSANWPRPRLSRLRFDEDFLRNCQNLESLIAGS